MTTQASPFTYEAFTINGIRLHRIFVGYDEIGMMQRVRGGWAAVAWMHAHGTTQTYEVFRTQAEVGWYWLKRKGATR